MSETAFDTLKIARALREAGFDDAQAEAIVATVGDAVRAYTTPVAASVATIADNMATKEHVATVADNVATISGTMATKEYVATISDNMATKEHVAAAVAGLRAEMAVEFKALYRHLWVMGTSIVGLTVALTKLFQ